MECFPIRPSPGPRYNAEAASATQSAEALRKELQETKWEFRACYQFLLDKLREFDVEEADRLKKRIKKLGWDVE